MRKITEEAKKAFDNNINWKKSNTEVKVIENTTLLYLFDNLIASKKNGEAEITDAGYCTQITKERLNGVFDISLRISKNEWYSNNVKWSGKWKFVNEFKK